MENKQLIIVTGSSRGLGSELVKQLLRKKLSTIGNSRGEVDTQYEKYFHIKADLGTDEGVAFFLSEVENRIKIENPTEVIFINNALNMQCYKEKIEQRDLTGKNLFLGVIAPVKISEFLIEISNNHFKLTLLNISSRITETFIGGLTLYGTIKSGTKYFFEKISQEFPSITSKNIEVGPMDTQMQQDLCLEECNPKSHSFLASF